LNSLLLDADITIELHVMGIWDKFVASNQVILPSSVFQEASFYKDRKGRRHPTNLNRDLKDGKIQRRQATAIEIGSIQGRFDQALGPSLGLGELEGLAILQREKTPHMKFCTADAAAWWATVLLDLGDRLISCEEALKQSGLMRSVHNKLSEKRFREKLGVYQEYKVRGFGLRI